MYLILSRDRFSFVEYEYFLILRKSCAFNELNLYQKCLLNSKDKLIHNLPYERAMRTPVLLVCLTAEAKRALASQLCCCFLLSGCVGLVASLSVGAI